MKKSILTISALAVALSITACSSGNNEEQVDENSVEDAGNAAVKAAAEAGDPVDDAFNQAEDNLDAQADEAKADETKSDVTKAEGKKAEAAAGAAETTGEEAQ